VSEKFKVLELFAYLDSFKDGMKKFKNKVLAS